MTSSTTRAAAASDSSVVRARCPDSSSHCPLTMAVSLTLGSQGFNILPEIGQDACQKETQRDAGEGTAGFRPDLPKLIGPGEKAAAALASRRTEAALTLLGRYAVAWAYLAGFVIAELIYAALPSRDQAAVLRWASTNVVNLHHDPVGSLVASAFIPAAFAASWPLLIALALFGANRALGNWRTAVVCAAGHVLGTLVSEGIVDYRVTRGLLPVSDTRIVDVGPSYIVVAAIAVAVLYGSWPARVTAALDFALLVFVGNIFGGLSKLNVAAVGHATAIMVGVLLGSLLAWQRGRSSQPQSSAVPAGP